jgi:hypothetical protein
VEVVKQFSYLGVKLNFNGKHYVTQKQLALQCRKALFALKRKYIDLQLNSVTLINLFDTYVSSIANYASEVWGFHLGADIEKVHLAFCKSTLRTKTSTPSSMVYYELGRMPLAITRKQRILKYWTKLTHTNNKLLKACYKEMYRECESNPNCSNWAAMIKKELFSMGLGEFWVEQYMSLEQTNYFLTLAKQRMKDQFIQTLQATFEASRKCLIYKNLANTFSLQAYLSKPIPSKFKIMISKIRLSSLNIEIEAGRYKGTRPAERLCPLCKLDQEDEFHFVLKCEFYKEHRLNLIKPYYRTNPSVWKLTQLLASSNTKELCNLGKYIHLSLNVRKAYHV